MEDSKSKIQPEDISSSDQESATEIEQTDQFIREASDESSSFFTFRSRVTISLPSEMELLRHEKEEDGGGNEEARFYLYQPPSVSEAGNSPSSLGSLESLTANEDSTEGDKKSATARNLSRSELNTQHKLNWEALKYDEINRFKLKVQALQAEKLENLGRLSEAQDTIGRLQEGTFLLESELDAERRRNEKLESAVVNAKQKAAMERAKSSSVGEKAEQLQKENRRLAREVDFLQADLNTAENEAKQSKEMVGNLQRELQQVGAKAALQTNKLLTLEDENALLAEEIADLRKSLSEANRESTNTRHENNKLQDKLHELNESGQELRLHSHTLQGQLTKEVNSLSRQLAAAREQVNAYKIRLVEGAPCSSNPQGLKIELAQVKRKYDELKKLFQMQQVNGSVRSRSMVRSTTTTTRGRGEQSFCQTDNQEVVETGRQPTLAGYLQLEEENKMLKMMIKAAKNLAQDG